MTDDTITTPAARRKTAFLLFTQYAPPRPTIDVDDFKGLQSLEEVKAWHDTMYPAAPEAGAIRTVTLCGSSRFRRHFVEWNAQLTRAGFLVYTLGLLSGGNPLTAPSPIEKAGLDAVHFAKIRNSDAILVIDAKVDGKPYIGESTAREIEWAELLGKQVFYAGDYTALEATKPDPHPWGAYSPEHLAEKISWLQGVLDGMYKACPAAMLAQSDGVWLADVHEEYGWSGTIDENAIAEEPETYPEGSRHIARFSGDMGEALLVIDRNSFDDALGRVAVRWHLEALTDDEKAKHTAAGPVARSAGGATIRPSVENHGR